MILTVVVIIVCCFIFPLESVDIPFDVLNCFEEKLCGIKSIGSYNFSIRTNEQISGHVFEIKNGLPYDVYFYWDVVEIITKATEESSKGNKRKQTEFKPWALYEVFVPSYKSIYIDTMKEESHMVRLYIRLETLVNDKDDNGNDDSNDDNDNDDDDDDNDNNHEENKNYTNTKNDNVEVEGDKSTSYTQTQQQQQQQQTTQKHVENKLEMKSESLHITLKETKKASPSSSHKRHTVYDYEVMDKEIGQKEKKIASGKISYNCDFFYKMCYFMLKYQSSSLSSGTTDLPRCNDGTYEAICDIDDKNRNANPQADVACINTCLTTYFSHIIDEKPNQFESEITLLERKEVLNKNDLLHCFFFSMVDKKNHLKGSFIDDSKEGNKLPFSKVDLEKMVKEDAQLASFLNTLDSSISSSSISSSSTCLNEENGWRTAVVVLSLLLAVVFIIGLLIWFFPMYSSRLPSMTTTWKKTNNSNSTTTVVNSSSGNSTTTSNTLFKKI